jgi:methylmalonyl-CoA mutase
MTDKSKQPLFSEFPPVSTQEWMDKITADLKGADFEKKLVWKTSEGFSVRPFYREEDLGALKHLNSLPGEFPFVRGNSTDNNWLVRQDIVVTDISSANAKAKDILKKGVESIGFVLDETVEASADNIKALLAGVDITSTEINFSTNKCMTSLAASILEAVKQMGVDPKKVKGSIDFDPAGKLILKDKTCKTIDEIMDRAAEIVKNGKALPSFQWINVNGKIFGNSGSTIVQELAFALSAANEYLAKLTERGLTVDEVAGSIRFTLSIGPVYFMEIAKLRAGRMLWSNIVSAYKPASTAAARMNVHCETSEFNMTVFDPYVNLLRTQTEAMSATLGGCHSLLVQPFDKPFRKAGEFSERIARNQQLLLKEESYFGKVADPGAGSYYIENLTESIANEAWKLFVEVESKGGYFSAVKEGFIQKLVKESGAQKLKAVASRKEVLLGTNQYPNVTETMKDAIEETAKACCGTSCSEGAEIETIVPFRAAAEFEALRLATEKAAKRPKTFMLTYGNLAMRLARSQFSGNFFGCAGYEIVDNLGFNTVEEGVEAAVKAGADIVVLCSSDEEYAEAAPAAFKALNGRAIFVVAGAPACMDDLKAQGIENFINIRSNVLEELQKFNKALGI